jgi:hypothetical protein
LNIAPHRAPGYIVHIEYLFVGFAVTRGPTFFLLGTDQIY